MSELPAAAVKANEDTLSQALEATHISEQETKEAAQEKPEETNGEQDGEKKDELEEGEIDEDEEDEVDDGKPKTVFDSARKFNLKVIARRGSSDSSTHFTLNGPFTLTLRNPRTCKRPTLSLQQVLAAAGSTLFARLLSLTLSRNSGDCTTP